jgi:hypothetical protein
MSDKRELKRRHIIYYLRVFDRNSGILIGHVIDITTMGMLVISENPIRVDTEFKFRMDLPTDTGTSFLDFDAVAIWCHQDVNPDFFDTGFRFMNVKVEDVEIIGRLIKLYGFNY